jgi:DNA invertase Pin-like site-specific DNA recombinase
MSKPLIAYYRVSTPKQGLSGLGLEAQEAAVRAYVERSGSSVVVSYTEVESGKHGDRPQLAIALRQAKLLRATLVVAKLDRLSRDVAFLATLMNTGGVPFVCCDMPSANRLTLHILAAVAEDEARRTSERTKAALQAAKARGVLLGSARPGAWEGREHLRRAGLKKARVVSLRVRRERLAEAHGELLPEVCALRAAGRSLRQIAAHLDAEGKVTLCGGRWSPCQVARLLRVGAAIRTNQ